MERSPRGKSQLAHLSSSFIIIIIIIIIIFFILRVSCHRCHRLFIFLYVIASWGAYHCITWHLFDMERHTPFLHRLGTMPVHSPVRNSWSTIRLTRLSLLDVLLYLPVRSSPLFLPPRQSQEKSAPAQIVWDDDEMEQEGKEGDIKKEICNSFHLSSLSPALLFRWFNIVPTPPFRRKKNKRSVPSFGSSRTNYTDTEQLKCTPASI